VLSVLTTLTRPCLARVETNRIVATPAPDRSRSIAPDRSRSIGRGKHPGGRAPAALGPAALWSIGLRFASPLGVAAIEDDAHVGTPCVQVREQVEEPPPQRTGDDQHLDDRLFDDRLLDQRLPDDRLFRVV